MTLGSRRYRKKAAKRRGATPASGQRRGGVQATAPAAAPPHVQPPAQPAVQAPWLVYFGVLACFFLSGFAALLYQTAWLRQFSLIFGTSELAVTTVLAAYMGGLALGSAVAGRYAGRVTRPVLAYGVLEGTPASVASVDVVELEPEVIEASRQLSGMRDADPLADPRINIVINDARNALRLTRKSYDAIVSQPSHPWTAGASHLFTREFAASVRSHLNDGGVFLQWMNAEFVDEPLLRTLAATLLAEFEYVRLYRPSARVLMFLASDAPLDVELELARSVSDHRHAGSHDAPRPRASFLRLHPSGRHVRFP